MADPRRTDFIDTIRGLAILGVIAYHVPDHYAPDQVWLATALSAGRMGVSLFFIASAVTLYHSFSNRRDEYKATSRFFVRRFFRIAPLYYVAAVFYTAYALLGGKSVSLLIPLTNVLFIHPFYPPAINSIPPGGWSVGVEMLFYLFLPLLFRYVTNTWRAAVLMVALVALALGARLLVGDPDSHSGLGEYFHLYPPNQFFVFGFGILVYFLIAKEMATEVARPNPWSDVLLLLSAALLVALSLFMRLGLAYELVFTVALSFFVYAVAHAPRRWLVNRFTRLVGVLSFSLYLTHFFVLDACEWAFRQCGVPNGTLGAIGLFAVALGGSMGLSMITKRTIEDRFIDYGKQLIKRRLSPPAVSS